MKKALVLFTTSFLLLIPAIGVCESKGWAGNLSGYLGYKDLDKDDWKPVDGQAEIGVLLDFRPKHWPVNIAIDYLVSDEYELRSISGSFVRIDGETSELAIGIRKVFEVFPTFRPYIGASVAYIRGEYEFNQFPARSSDDDSAMGYVINAGVYWAFAEHLQIGLDLRYSRAEIKLFGADVEAGGVHAGVTFGLRW